MSSVERAFGTGSTNNEKHSVLRWYYDPRSVILIITILAVAITLPAWRLLNDTFEWMHPALAAIIGGAITTLLVYPICSWADATYGLSTAVLLGLVSASFTVYGAPLRGEVVAPLIIAFYAFHVFFGYTEAEHLDPPLYRAYVTGGTVKPGEHNNGDTPVQTELKRLEVSNFIANQ